MGTKFLYDVCIEYPKEKTKQVDIKWDSERFDEWVKKYSEMENREEG
jgi:hypothetical protein